MKFSPNVSRRWRLNSYINFTFATIRKLQAEPSEKFIKNGKASEKKLIRGMDIYASMRIGTVKIKRLKKYDLKFTRGGTYLFARLPTFLARKYVP